jgi:hypothetical protein
MSIEQSATDGHVEAAARTDRMGSQASAMAETPAASGDPLRAYSRDLRAQAAQACSMSIELRAKSERLASALMQARGALARALGDD